MCCDKCCYICMHLTANPSFSFRFRLFSRLEYSMQSKMSPRMPRTLSPACRCGGNAKMFHLCCASFPYSNFGFCLGSSFSLFLFLFLSPSDCLFFFYSPFFSFPFFLFPFLQAILTQFTKNSVSIPLSIQPIEQTLHAYWGVPDLSWYTCGRSHIEQDGSGQVVWSAPSLHPMIFI